MMDEFWLRLGFLYLWFHTPWNEKQRQEFNELVVLATVFIAMPMVVYIFLLQHRAEIADRLAHEIRMKKLREMKAGIEKIVKEKWKHDRMES